MGRRLHVYTDHVRLPDGREIEDYLQISMPDFATIVAQTSDGHILCERQYKHGPKRISLTLPAGGLEPGEDVLLGAQRELLEETGYVSDEWAFLGSRVIHANAGGGRTHAFVARNCRKIAKPQSGDLETMEILLQTPKEMMMALRNDEMPLVADIAALLPALLMLEILKECD